MVEWQWARLKENRQDFDAAYDTLISSLNKFTKDFFLLGPAVIKQNWKDKMEEAAVLMKDIPGACDKHIAALDSEAKSLIAIQKIKGAKSPVKKERI